MWNFDIISLCASVREREGYNPLPPSPFPLRVYFVIQMLYEISMNLCSRALNEIKMTLQGDFRAWINDSFESLFKFTNKKLPVDLTAYHLWMWDIKLILSPMAPMANDAWWWRYFSFLLMSLNQFLIYKIHGQPSTNFFFFFFLSTNLMTLSTSIGQGALLVQNLASYCSNTKPNIE